MSWLCDEMRPRWDRRVVASSRRPRFGATPRHSRHAHDRPHRFRAIWIPRLLDGFRPHRSATNPSRQPDSGAHQRRLSRDEPHRRALRIPVVRLGISVPSGFTGDHWSAHPSFVLDLRGRSARIHRPSWFHFCWPSHLLPGHTRCRFVLRPDGRQVSAAIRARPTSAVALTRPCHWSRPRGQRETSATGIKRPPTRRTRPSPSYRRAASSSGR